MQISGNVIKIFSWNIKEIFSRCQGARVPSLGSPRDTWYLEEWCRHSRAPDTQQPITLSARHGSFHKKSFPTVFCNILTSVQHKEVFQFGSGKHSEWFYAKFWKIRNWAHAAGCTHTRPPTYCMQASWNEMEGTRVSPSQPTRPN